MNSIFQVPLKEDGASGCIYSQAYLGKNDKA